MLEKQLLDHERSTRILITTGLRDHVVAVGLEFQWTTEDNLTIVLRGLQELASTNRTQGTNVNLSFTLPLSGPAAAPPAAAPSPAP